MSTKAIKDCIGQTMAHLPNRDNVRRIRLFGSYLHQAAQPSSDVDLLIEFEQPVGYFELVRIQDQLSRALGKSVDLVTPNALSKYFRDEVLREAEEVYGKRLTCRRFKVCL